MFKITPNAKLPLRQKHNRPFYRKYEKFVSKLNVADMFNVPSQSTVDAVGIEIKRQKKPFKVAQRMQKNGSFNVHLIALPTKVAELEVTAPADSAFEDAIFKSAVIKNVEEIFQDVMTSNGFDHTAR